MYKKVLFMLVLVIVSVSWFSAPASADQDFNPRVTDDGWVPVKTDLAFKSNIVWSTGMYHFPLGDGTESDSTYNQVLIDIGRGVDIVVNNPDKLYVWIITGLTDKRDYRGPNGEFLPISPELNYALGFWRCHDGYETLSPKLKAADSVHNYFFVYGSQRDFEVESGLKRGWRIELLEIDLKGSAKFNIWELYTSFIKGWIDDRIPEQEPEPSDTLAIQVGVGATTGFFKAGPLASLGLNFGRWNAQVYGCISPFTDERFYHEIDGIDRTRSWFGGFFLAYEFWDRMNLDAGIGYEWHEDRYHYDHTAFEDADNFVFVLAWTHPKWNLTARGVYMRAPLWELEHDGLRLKDEMRIDVVKFFDTFKPFAR